MYFSVILAAPGREAEAAREWAGGPFVEHDWLWNCLCGAPGVTPDFLFRRGDIDSSPRIFAVTAQRPLPLTDIWEMTTREYDSRTQVVQQRGESGVPFSTVDLSGELTVVDPVTFGFALQRGIGRAKPFGCGLLLLEEELNRSRT